MTAFGIFFAAYQTSRVITIFIVKHSNSSVLMSYLEGMSALSWMTLGVARTIGMSEM
jgi:hypothetical protein